MKFNGIVIAFVGGQIFNGFTGQKAQPEPLLHSLSQLEVPTLDSPSGRPKKEKRKELRTALSSSVLQRIIASDK